MSGLEVEDDQVRQVGSVFVLAAKYQELVPLV